MISFLFISIVTLSQATSDEEANVCSMEWNPVCCPDPKFYTLDSVDDYRQYGNVCEFGYGTDDEGNAEDPIACGYGTCPVCLCAMIYDPVCCGGTEYPNQCEADCVGATDCTMGACPDPCPCTAEYRPLCCPDLDNAEYSNPCTAECDGLTTADFIGCHWGTCENPEDVCMCTMEYDPVCCDGVDFASQCVADCEEATNCVPGECEVCMCTLEYNPVCCDDGNTYGNPCNAKCHLGDAELLKCYYGECPTCACPMLWEPTCCNGVEYGNSCEADCAGAIGCTGLPCEDDQGEDSDTDTDGDNGKGTNSIKPKKSEVEEEEGYVVNEAAAVFETKSVTDCACTLDWSPVCCDGDTYGNQCEADCDGAQNCVDDACDSSLCTCTREYNPVCCPAPEGSDEADEQFSNPCTAACSKTDAELIDCHFGQCESACACIALWDPVCCGGSEFGNQCMANCAGFEDSECDQGECPQACTLEYDPQCCDGVEYSNPCLAEVAGATNCEAGTCEEECLCTLEFIPVCCGDKTYGNACSAECADEDLISCEYGECEEEVCDCKADKGKTVCCSSDDGDNEYKNKCLAKCAGEDQKNCKTRSCSVDIEPYAEEEGANIITDPTEVTGIAKYGFNINTILLGLILVAMVSFVYIYAKRTDPARFRKEIYYDNDQ